MNQQEFLAGMDQITTMVKSAEKLVMQSGNTDMAEAMLTFASLAMPKLVELSEALTLLGESSKGILDTAGGEMN